MSNITFRVDSKDDDQYLIKHILNLLMLKNVIENDISVETHLDNLEMTGKTFVIFKGYIPIKAICTDTDLISLYYMNNLQENRNTITSQLYLNVRPIGFEQKVSCSTIEDDDE
jgi:hypothetical protein